MIYEVNKCTEYAMKDSEGQKLDVKGINTAIEAVKSGSVPFYNSLDEVPTDGSMPNIFGLLLDLDDSYLCYRINDIKFIAFQIYDQGKLYANQHEYNSETQTWSHIVIYDDVTIPTETGTKLYRHVSPVSQSSGVEIISTVSTPFDLSQACTGNHLFFNIGIAGSSYKVISTYFDYPNSVYKLYYINSSGALAHYDVSYTSSYTDTVTPL